ncbi:MAG: class I SAM-dependent methyltransferase [Candidatus Yanofskybacteria bacterium]|nr:class I SAM-dependent methyltransferase [Candidatus Yanofskybacteria bacterium]
MNETENTKIQKSINATWKDVWDREIRLNKIDKILKNQLFVNAYPVIKKYIPSGYFNFLEVGAGTGRYGVALARDFPQSRFVLTDILDESLSVAKELAVRSNVTNVEFRQADVFDLPFSDGEFDIVFSDATIQHLKDYKKAFAGMVRVLRKGGILIVTGNNYWNPHKLLKTIKGRSYEYGFEKSFKIKELKDLAGEFGCEVLATDGFFVAYGISRYHPKFMKISARILDAIVRLLDSVSNRYVSRHFGFEVFIVAQSR